jgi:hypothetical protein
VKAHRHAQLVLLLLTIASAHRPLSAQATPAGAAPARASVTGVATDRASHPIGDVEITLVEAQRTAITDAAGSYRIADVLPGTYTLSARRLGYDGVRARVELRAGATLAADIELKPLAQQLERVVVRTDSARTGLRHLIEARNVGGAALFFRETLDSARGTSVADLVSRKARGVHLIRYSRTGGLLVASTRGAMSISRKLPMADPTDMTSPRACYAQIFLDGIRIYDPGSDFAVPDLSKFDAASLEALEVYPGPATTPAEYGGTGAQCGTVALWTRAR